ncbi:PadR family transcriptional regulator [Actinopolymorpha alba]|uniref:PadR family transcriptional regulator n=1 Tax=Actinopolymorpha alba TaxID=533267 RepID=UPI00037EBF30|nr:PadR family transcriptional regulator [Actinopolymorpha alba]
MARRRKQEDLVGLTVLALLVQGPRHPYELHRFIVDTHKDYITGLPRSLYHAVDRLARDELIVPVETHREGRRPERTVYEITADGRADLAGRLRRLLEDSGVDGATFAAAISLMGCLPPGDVERCLATRAASLEGAIASLDGVASSQIEGGLPRLLVLELEYESAVKAAELAWVRSLLDEIRAGKLRWSATLSGEDLGAVHAYLTRESTPPGGRSTDT